MSISSKQNCLLSVTFSFLKKRAKQKQTMTSFNCKWSLIFLIVGSMTFFHQTMAADYYSTPTIRPTTFKAMPWKQAFATFYGDESASETMGALRTLVSQ